MANNPRGERYREDLLEATIELMLSGNFRPIVEEICEVARCAPRTLYAHYGSVERLHLAAIEYPDVREGMLRKMVGPTLWGLMPEDSTHRVARAVARAMVTGKSKVVQ